MGWWDLNIQEGTEVCGDEPADIMGEALDKLVKLWQDVWGRNPTGREIVETLKFSSGHLDDKIMNGIDELIMPQQ